MTNAFTVHPQKIGGRAAFHLTGVVGLAVRRTEVEAVLGADGLAHLSADVDQIVDLGVVDLYPAQPDVVEVLGHVGDVVVAERRQKDTAIGAAGIPSAGLVMIFIVTQAVGFQDADVAVIIGTMLAVDRPLDMMRTMVNIFSDSIGAAVIAKSEGETLYK